MTGTVEHFYLCAAADSEEPVPTDESPTKKLTIPSPTVCRKLARRRMARSMTKIVAVLGDKAEQGSVPHTSLLAKLGGFDRRPIPAPKTRRGKSLAQRLFEEIEEHEAKMIARNKARDEARLAADHAAVNASE